MKRNAFVTLIADVLMGLVTWGLGAMLVKSCFAMDGSAAMSAAVYIACIPYGWRWASRIISAVSLKGLGIKLLFSLFLGVFAVFVILGGDVIRCIGSLIRSGAQGVRSAKASGIR